MASAEHYRAHLLPIYEALPPEQRGAVLRSVPLRRRGPQPERNAVLVGSWTDLRAVGEAGYERIVYAEHGIGQTYQTGHPAYPGGRHRDRVGLFLSPNATAARYDAEAYPAATVRVVGDPALDALPRGPGAGPIAVSFHWDCMVAPETRSTFRYWITAVRDLAQEQDVIGHGHPRAINPLKGMYRAAGVRWVENWHAVCEQAALYICDNSSTLYEFAATGRPVVVLNGPNYRRGFRPGLRFWDAANVGFQVDRPVALAETVLRAVEDPPDVRQRREAAVDIAYGYRSGAAQRAADTIMEWL